MLWKLWEGWDSLPPSWLYCALAVILSDCILLLIISPPFIQIELYWNLKAIKQYNPVSTEKFWLVFLYIFNFDEVYY